MSRMSVTEDSIPQLESAPQLESTLILSSASICDKSVVFGVFDNRKKLEQAVGQLRLDGFPASKISVLFSLPNIYSIKHSVAESDEHSLRGELSWLSGAGEVLLPGGYQFLATGPLMEAVAHVDIKHMHHCVAEGIASLGIPLEIAKLYEDYVLNGEILLGLSLDEIIQIQLAYQILEEYGASDIIFPREIEGSL